MACSNFWRLDKIDKIVISLILIVVSMFSIFNCFCFASEDIEISVLNGLNSPSGWNGYLQEDATCVGVFFPVKRGHTYTISFDYDGTFPNFPIGRTSELPSAGVYFSYLTSFTSTKKSHTFTASSDDFMYIYMYTWKIAPGMDDMSEFITVTDNTVGFDLAITDLFYSVGISHLWSVFETSMPYILIVVLFAFGWWFFSHWIKEISKGREF